MTEAVIASRTPFQVDVEAAKTITDAVVTGTKISHFVALHIRELP